LEGQRDDADGRQRQANAEVAAAADGATDPHHDGNVAAGDEATHDGEHHRPLMMRSMSYKRYLKIATPAATGTPARAK
jgi:hypothetical protein